MLLAYKSIFFLTLNLGIAACGNSLDERNEVIDEITASSRSYAHADPPHGDPEKWSGTVSEDCSGPGLDCAVVTPTAVHNGFIAAEDWDNLFKGDSTTFGLNQSTVDDVLDGTLLIYSKDRGSDTQLRIK